MRRVVAVLVLAVSAGAIEPKEVYARGCDATVLITTDKGVGLGVAIDARHVVTPLPVIDGAKSITFRSRDGKALAASLVGMDTRARLALYKVDGYAGKTLALAPVIRDAGSLVDARVYSVGRPAEAGQDWPFLMGRVERLAAQKDLAALVAIESDLLAEHAGAPLLDAEGRLLGVTLRGKRAIPVNAVRRLLARNGFSDLALPKDAVKVTDRAGLAPPKEKPDPPEKKGPASVELPKRLFFGPYRHSFASRERRSLEKRVANMLRGLVDLYVRCPRCRGAGKIRVLDKPGYWATPELWVEPVYKNITCPRCTGARRLFNPGKAERVFLNTTHAEQGSGRDFAGAQREFVRRCERAGHSYRRGPKFSVEVRGRFGVARSKDPLFPLRFKLVAVGTDYEWFLHDERTNGPFDMEREGTPPEGAARVAAVAAGDILVLEGGRIVRLCGIAVPNADGKLPTSHIAAGNEEVRKHVEKLLVGKEVRLALDKYATVTLDGHTIAFVELDGNDLGEDLLRIGLVRRHPRHAHIRMDRYKRAESAARKDQVGIWKR